MTQDIKKLIKENGYWRVIIRTSKEFYNNKRFKIENLSKIIEQTQVRLRGWYYPHIKQEDVEITAQDKIGFGCQFEGENEYWEFTTSGQFVHIFSMREDFMIKKQEAEKISQRFIFNKDKTVQINNFFEVVNATYRFTEIYLFASNLAQLKEYEDVDKFEIIVELHGVKDRSLFIWDFRRDLWSPYICRIEGDKIEFDDIINKDELIGEFNHFALKNILETFKRFGWIEPNERAISEDQEKLLERRL